MHFNYHGRKEQIKPEHIWYLTWLLALLLSVVFYFCWYQPLQAKLTTLREQTQSLHLQTQTLQQAQQSYGDIKTYAQELHQQQQHFAQVLPKELAANKFLTTIQRLAALHGVTLTKVVPNRENTEENVAVLPIQLHFTGSYFQILDFWHDLQAQQRLLQVREFSLQIDAQGSAKLLGNATICIFAVKKA